MHTRRIPGSDVSPGLAAAFVVALALLLLLTDPGSLQPRETSDALTPVTDPCVEQTAPELAGVVPPEVVLGG